MNLVSNASFHEFGPQGKPVRNDALDVAAKFASEKQYGFAKAIYVLGVDLTRALGLVSKENATATLIKENASLFKLSRSPAMFIDSVNTTVRSTWSYLTGNPIVSGRDKTASVKPLSQVVRDATGIVNPVNEMATFLTKAILFIPKASIHVLKGINGIALTFAMSWCAYESLCVLAKGRVSDLTNDDQIVARERENVGALLNLVREVSYVALGIIMTLAVFASVAVNPLVMTALSVTTVVFTILHFYHKNLGQEKKLT